MKWQEMMPWLAPIIFSLIIGIFQLYGLIEKVHIIENTQQTEGVKAIKKLDNISYRVERLEEFCCDEISTIDKDNEIYSLNE